MHQVLKTGERKDVEIIFFGGVTGVGKTRGVMKMFPDAILPEYGTTKPWWGNAEQPPEFGTTIFIDEPVRPGCAC